MKKVIISGFLLLVCFGFCLAGSGPVWGESASSAGRPAFEYTKSDGKQTWKIKIFFGPNRAEKTSADTFSSIFYPSLLVPGVPLNPYRIYYKLVPSNQTRVLPYSVIYLRRRRFRLPDPKERLKVELSVPDEDKAEKDNKKVRTGVRSGLEKRLKRGLEFFRKEEFEKATRIFKEVILLVPEDGVAKIFYGHALFARADYSLAAKSIRRGMELIKGFEDTPMRLEEFYDKPETLKKQILDLVAWVKYNKEDEGARFLLGYVYFFTGQVEKVQVILARLQKLSRKTGLDLQVKVLLQKAEENLKQSPEVLLKRDPRSASGAKKTSSDKVAERKK